MPYFEVHLTRKLQRIYDIGPDTVIGRAPQCHIQLLSRAVSRRHARVEYGDQGEVIISDLGTKNGVKLNGQKVQGAAVMGEGDQLLVGDVQMVFRSADRTVIPSDAIDLRNRPAGPADLQAALRPRVTFVLRAEPDGLAQFGSTVARARIGRLEFDDLTKFKLQIALKEALDNALIHGSRRDPARSIYVTFSEDQDEFVMSVRDEGAGFDFERTVGGAEEVDPLEAIRARQQFRGPLGLRIILSSVDRLQFDASASTIHMGRFKAGGELFVISDDSGSQPALPALGDPLSATSDDPDEPAAPRGGPPAPPPPLPGGPRPGPLDRDDGDETGPLRLDDLF